MARKKVPHQEWYGRSFYQDKSTGYWISVDAPRLRAHRWVWNNVNGTIPESCQIHHRDGNKSNNDISNLQLVSHRQHALLHLTEEKREKLRKQANSVRHLTKEWHKSKEGRAWHKYHAQKEGFGKWEFPEKACGHCQRPFKPANHHNIFCSNACKSAWRRAKKLDHVDLVCKGCGQVFSENKYAKRIYCSRACAKRIA